MPDKPGSQSGTGTTASSLAESLAGLREEFFSFLALEFPTLCLFDEFIYFPRLSAAWENWFQLPRLKAEFLAKATARLREFESRLSQLRPAGGAPELAEEAALLRHCLAGSSRELGSGGSWRYDPFLYLKTASLAWAPVLAQAPQVDWRDREALRELLARTARFWGWGRRQLGPVSKPVQLLAPAAFEDARRFFGQTVPDFLAETFPGFRGFKSLLAEIYRSLRLFEAAVANLPVTRPLALGEEGLAILLDSSWGWNRGLEAAREILAVEVEESESALRQLGSRMPGGPDWAVILQEATQPPGRSDLLSLYRQEVENLWDFWQQAGVLPPLTGRVVVAETPLYLRSLRSSASYAAPWGPPEENPGYFYVTPETEGRRHHLQHLRFLSAHETVPGHHFLDSTRLALASPLRRQYESPLFYEGWACYGETLLLSEGYLSEPRERLVGWQRRLWRALRGMADLEVHCGRLDLEGSLKLLRRAAYPETSMRLQVLHQALNPGYQLCYTLGLKEILGLRERFAPTLRLGRFHQVLLSGGQLPFDLAARRLQAAG